MVWGVCRMMMVRAYLDDINRDPQIHHWAGKIAAAA
jgi:hypothetical protein